MLRLPNLAFNGLDTGDIRPPDGAVQYVHVYPGHCQEEAYDIFAMAAINKIIESDSEPPIVPAGLRTRRPGRRRLRASAPAHMHANVQWTPERVARIKGGRE